MHVTRSSFSHHIFILENWRWQRPIETRLALCSNVFVSYPYRPTWIRIYGQEFHHSEYLLCGWQDNDLPVFGMIKDILVIAGTPLISLCLHKTLGINNHLLCFAITSAYQSSLISLSHVVYRRPLCAHSILGDGHLYIAMRSHVTQC